MISGLLSLHETFDTACPDTRRTTTDARAHVNSVIRLLLQRTMAVERRRERRYPFPHLVTLIPVAPDGTHLTSETTVVVGKQLSLGGLSFFHRQPIPYRRAVVVFELGSHRTALLTDLTWCRFTRHGWYENGGRFLQAVTTQMSCGQSEEETYNLRAETSSCSEKIT
jgi:hypothetical protein